MRWESQQAFAERFAPYGLRRQAMTTCYAMAENVFAVSQGGWDRPGSGGRDRPGRLPELTTWPGRLSPNRPSIKMLSAGRPIEGTHVKIVSEHGKELPERVVGEVALHSDCMLTGYYHRARCHRKGPCAAAGT